MNDRAEVTTLLKAWSNGDQEALDRLAERVYGELHRMARRFTKNERPEKSLQATALVHEVYLRLVDVSTVQYRERAQFFAMASQMMRRILVDAARAKHARKRGGQAIHVKFEETAVLAPEPDRSMIALDDALAAFSSVAERQAKVVELRCFGGLTEEEIANVLEISPRTVRRDWEFARVWLARELAAVPGTARMTPEQLRQIEQLFHAVREQSAEERAPLLAGADPDLRREVESLLAQQPGNLLLDRPAATGDSPSQDETRTSMPAAGMRLGPYRLEGKLGAGGMGEVFRAVDTRLDRAVAIKITTSGSAPGSIAKRGRSPP